MTVHVPPLAKYSQDCVVNSLGFVFSSFSLHFRFSSFGPNLLPRESKGRKEHNTNVRIGRNHSRQWYSPPPLSDPLLTRRPANRSYSPHPWRISSCWSPADQRKCRQYQIINPTCTKKSVISHTVHLNKSDGTARDLPIRQ
jgi:hypothetical protein